MSKWKDFEKGERDGERKSAMCDAASKRVRYMRWDVMMAARSRLEVLLLLFLLVSQQRLGLLSMSRRRVAHGGGELALRRLLIGRSRFERSESLVLALSPARRAGNERTLVARQTGATRQSSLVLATTGHDRRPKTDPRSVS